MVLCAFVRAAVGTPGSSSRPLSPFGSAGVAAVGVPPVAAAVDVKVGVAPATGDLVELRRSPARPLSGPPGRWDALSQRSVSLRRRRAHSRRRHPRLLRGHPRRGLLPSPVLAGGDDDSSPAPARRPPRRRPGGLWTVPWLPAPVDSRWTAWRYRARCCAATPAHRLPTVALDSSPAFGLRPAHSHLDNPPLRSGLPTLPTAPATTSFSFSFLSSLRFGARPGSDRCAVPRGLAG